MVRIFVATVLVSIVICTEPLKIIAASEEFYDSCQEVMFSANVEQIDKNNEQLKCWDCIEFLGCYGGCISSETPSLMGTVYNNPVCKFKSSKIQNVTLRDCDEGVAPETRIFRYLEPIGCSCSKCKEADTCQYLTYASRFESQRRCTNPGFARPDSNTVFLAGEKTRRRTSPILKSESSYPKYFDVMLAESEDRKESPSRLWSQSSHSRYPAYVESRGEKNRKENPLSSKSQSSYPTYVDFVPLAESEDTKEHPSRSTSQFSDPRYSVSVQSAGWKKPRPWFSNVPPSLLHRFRYD